MKYVSPKYSSEVVETNDIMSDSPFTVAHIKDEQGNVAGAQIIVDANKLFNGF